MSSIPFSSRDPGRSVVPRAPGYEHQLAPWNLNRAIWAFVASAWCFGSCADAMDYPLWWDEAFVAVNFIRRDYLELLRPLDYGQVCPILFLWIELTIVKLLGFSEWSLRLFPLGCGLVSVVLFRHVAGRVLQGVPLLLAVAIFAVAYHPIRHAADVKPYASDLLAALVLIAAAFEWWRMPERAVGMWALAAIAPVALAYLIRRSSWLAGLPWVSSRASPKPRRLPVWIAYATFSLSTVGSFLALYLTFTRSQAHATLAGMQVQWVAAFPPLANPLKLMGWFLTVHTGSMFAYPCGGERGASSLTLLLFLIGAWTMWTRGHKAIVLTCLAPFGLAIVAAAIRRYPYGGVADGSPARVMQYLAPSICLLTGLGFAIVVGCFRSRSEGGWVFRIGLVVLVAAGVVPLVAEAGHPFRSIHAQRARQFAREFWPTFESQAEPVCLRWDLGLGAWDSTNLNVAVYLCNQMIYAPRRHEAREPCLQRVSANRPLRCVLSLEDPADRPVRDWLAAMKNRYRLRECRQVVVDMAAQGAKPRSERYVVYEFVPL